MVRWLLDALVGAALGALAVVVGQFATKGGVSDLTVPAAVAIASFILYPVFSRRARRR
jgi:hypothetical protein